MIDVCGTPPTPMRASARLIVNRASLTTRYGAIHALIDALRSQIPIRHGGTRCD